MSLPSLVHVVELLLVTASVQTHLTAAVNGVGAARLLRDIAKARHLRFLPPLLVQLLPQCHNQQPLVQLRPFLIPTVIPE